MKKLAMLAGWLLLSGTIAAQKPADFATGSEKGLSYVEFETEGGIIRALLPSRVHAGDVISGTVVAEPAGKNERQLTRNAQTIEGYVIGVEDGATPVKEGKFTWKIPAAAAAGAVSLVIKDSQGREVARKSYPVAATPRLAGRDGLLQSNDFALPDYLRAGQEERITGMFDGDSRNSRISLGDSELKILAESPEGIFIEIPEKMAGESTLEVAEKDFSLRREVNVLEMHLSADRLTLVRGQKANVGIEVSGLKGLESAVSLTLTNLTPENISLEGGTLQQINIGREDADPTGIFRKNAVVSALRSGAFSVMVAVDPPRSQLLHIISPVNGSVTDTDFPEIRWNSIGFPDHTYYDLFVCSLPEELAQASHEKAGINERVNPAMVPVYETRKLGTSSHILPEEWMAAHDEGHFTVWIEARDGLSGEKLGETVSGFQTLSASKKCHCGDTSGSYVHADIKTGENVIAMARLTQNPSTLLLPAGPLTVVFTEAGLSCGTCGGNECTVEDVVYDPAAPVIMPTAETRVLKVKVTWKCKHAGCGEKMCEKILQLDYKLAPGDCQCGDIALTVEATNVKARNPKNSGSSETAESHRPAGSTGAVLMKIGEDFSYENGDEVKIRISGIQVRCWCQTGQCDAKPAHKKDKDDGRPVTIELGENEKDASNQNHNMVRISKEGDGWQADGSYIIHAVFSDSGSTEKAVYQDFKLQFDCTRTDCDPSLCEETFRIHF